MPESTATALQALQDRLRYRFREPELLETALTHSSFAQEHPGCENNQRLEFLGDAVIQILVAEELYRLFPRDREGQLSRHRALLVNGGFLAQLATEIGLETCLRLGASEATTGGRTRASTLGDAFEALIGAIYLDSDFATVRRIGRDIYGDIAQRLSEPAKTDNPKGRLQERVQPLHGNSALRYIVTRSEGLDHVRLFEVAVQLNDRLIGSGRGTSKKLAEAAAARAALTTLGDADA